MTNTRKGLLMSPLRFVEGVVARVCLCAGLAVSAAAPALAQFQPVSPTPATTQRVLEKYPGSRAQMMGDRVVAVFGKRMDKRATPVEAAEFWLVENAMAFDAGELDLRPVREIPTGDGKFTIFHYVQEMEGLPVEYGMARLAVLNAPDGQSVVFAGAKLAKLAEGATLNPRIITGEQAIDIVAQMPEYILLEEFTQPQEVVYFGEGDKEQWMNPVRVWKFVGEIPAIDRMRKLTFFVDATTGALIHARNDILTVDVEGTVQAWATPTPPGNAAADHAGNPPVLQTIPRIRVQITGGMAVFSGLDGSFLIPNAGSGPVTVSTTLSSGQFTNVEDGASTPLGSASAAGVMPPGPVDLAMNPVPSQYTTAQVNAFIAQTLTHNHFRSRAPGFTQLDPNLPARVNLASTSGITSCNATYSGTATNFLRAGGGCNNTAFSAVVAHEYGHHIVSTLGLSQGAFGEGFGDTMSMMIYDDPVMGRFFRTNGDPVRTPVTANIQYPCSTCGGAIHCCGQIISATIWRLRNNFVNTYGPETGLEMVRQLHVNWALITNGGQGTNSAHPTTAIEMLTADDDDGDLANGTPHYSLICNAFSQASIACPPLAPVEWVFPGGRPSLVPPSQSQEIVVNVLSLAQTPAPGTGELIYRINGGSFTTVPMTQSQTNQYIASIPAQSCGDIVQYYFRVGLQGGGTASNPGNAPASFYNATIGTDVAVVFSDTFETNLGWNNPQPAHTASAGIWQRAIPVGTAAAPGNQTTPGGQWCYVTQNGIPGGAVGSADVDNGTTFLVSPVIDLSNPDFVDIDISYSRWFSNNAGASPNTDTFRVDISSNNGSSWTNLETIGPAGAGTSGGWISHALRLSSYPAVARTATMRLRFVAEDLNPQSLVEAAVDDVVISAVLCEKTPPLPTCPGDANADGVVNGADLSVLLGNFGLAGAGPEFGDFNGDGFCNGADLSVLLSQFGVTCK